MLPPEQPTVHERLIAAFAGAVQIGAASPAVNCRLAGLERGTGIALEVHFSGASGGLSAGTHRDLQVFELSRGSERHWLLQQGGTRHVLRARAAQVHRMPASAFFAAVPGPRLTLATRIGWVLLLTLLRIPGVARLIAWLRSPRT
ncbi:MAG: hypothetical protein ABSE43_05940 [Steroidobacteraceae bacterium]|jgi:hypothetical protein